MVRILLMKKHNACMKTFLNTLLFGAALFCGAVPLSVAAEAPALPAEVKAAFDAYCALPAELLPVLERVQDKTSADAAAPSLHAALDKIYTTRNAMQKVQELTPEQTELVQQRYAARMRQDWGRVYEHIFRLRKAQCYGSIAFVNEFGYMTLMLAQ